MNSVAVIVASSMATVLALRFSETWGELLATILISFVVLIFCEITPKTAAVQSPLRWARALVRPVRVAAWVLHPLVRSLSVITSLFVRMLGGQIKHRGPFVTEEELRLLVTVGEEEGVLEEEETEMIHSIFEFADTTAREVMVPRIDMITLASDMKVTEAVDLALQGGFSRIPVYEVDTGADEIIGVLYTKDLLKQLRDDHDSVQIRDLVRPAYFVPETKKLDDLLREIRHNRVHMVIVVDEYGSVAGLVTIEDLVEEIIGDIKDEYDREENLYEKINEDEYIFDAKISIYEFNDMMGKHLEDLDYETLGGFVYAQLDKIPVADDTVTFEDLIFTVLATRGRRITKIRVQRKHEEVNTLTRRWKSRSAAAALTCRYVTERWTHLIDDPEQVRYPEELDMSATPLLPTAVRVVEVGPRDGLQNEHVQVPTQQKIQFIQMLAEAGLPVVEATSFVSPRAIPQLSDASAVMTSLLRLPTTSYPVLVPNLKGMERALAAGVRAISVFTAASESFTRHNINATIAESLANFRPVLELAGRENIAVRGYISTVFGCPYEGFVAPQQVLSVAQALLEMGIAELSLGDTIGVATPNQVVDVLGLLTSNGIASERLAVHFHDTRGTALANVLMALQMGITIVDAAAGGLGGCPYAPGAAGNLATEDLLYMLHGMGISTGVDLDKVVAATRFIAPLLGHTPTSKYYQAALAI